MLEKGVNAYLTLEEASALIGDPAWGTATDEARADALIAASSAVDTLPYRGRREKADQLLEWPRVMSGGRPRENDFSITGHAVFPERVKRAVALEALARLKGADKRTSLREAGVKSFRYGNTSETFTDGGAPALHNPQALRLLFAYTGADII